MAASIVSTFSKKTTCGVAALALLTLAAIPSAAQRKAIAPEAQEASGGALPELPKKPGPLVPQVDVFFCEVSDVSCRTSISDFEAYKIRDLFVFVAYRNIPQGQHKQELRFVLPNGDLYLSKNETFSTGPTKTARAGGTENLRSWGRPAPKQSEQFVKAVLPVAGTYITQRALTGAWTVQVVLDGKLMTTRNLTLKPPQGQQEQRAQKAKAAEPGKKLEDTGRKPLTKWN